MTGNTTISFMALSKTFTIQVSVIYVSFLKAYFHRVLQKQDNCLGLLRGFVVLPTTCVASMTVAVFSAPP